MIERLTANLPKLLVLGNLLPGSRDGGGVVKDEILKHYPKDRYVCFAIEHPKDWKSDEDKPESVQAVPYLIGPLVPRLHISGARFYMPVLRAIGFHLIAPLRIRQVIEFGRRHRIELIWAELQYDIILIAQRVAEELGVPFVGTVWDDPDSWLKDLGYHWSYYKFIKKRFRNSLLAARNLSTAGEAMQNAYEREYGVKSVILRHGFEVPVISSINRKQNDSIVIGFVGSLYGRDAWEAFLSAVVILNASGKLPSISLRIFGGGEFPFKQDGVKIELRGWQQAKIMLKEIAETDFCYLPYWFETHKKRHVELSFPNKFETYIAAGRPILFHGPEYAGIARIINQYKVGLCVHSLNQREIISSLECLVTDFFLRDSFSRAAILAFWKEFNANVMMNNFAKLIGIDPNILLGAKQNKSELI
jgi:glycosyltransferase involved in cell wall biosynthesis